MHYRRMGRWGLKISDISLGGWLTFGDQVEEKTAVDLVHAAYDHGINFFDSADINAKGQGEMVMGKAIKGLSRDELVISSKVFWPTVPGPNGHSISRKHIVQSLHHTLKRLDTSYLDIYFCHDFDPDTPYEEIAYTMHNLVQQGKILYWGTSNWRATQIATAHGVARNFNLIPPAVEQSQYNMFFRSRVEVELAPLSKDRGLGIMTWGPLYSGLLSGKYNDAIPENSRAARQDLGWVRDRVTPERLHKVRQITTLATQLDLTTAQLAIAWTLRRKDVATVITGATSVEQLEENVEACDAVVHLTDEVQEEIEKILENLPEETSEE